MSSAERKHYNQAYYYANHARIRARRKAAYAANLEYYRKYYRDYYKRIGKQKRYLAQSEQ